MQNYLVFQPVYRNFKIVINGTTVYAHYWESKGLSDGKINPPGISSSNDQAQILKNEINKIRLQFVGDIIKQNKVACNHRKIYAEQTYPTNFTVTNKKFCLSLHYNGYNSYLFVHGKEIVKFESKDSEIVPYPLCLGNISKDFNLTIHKKQDYLDMFMNLVLIIEPFQMIKYTVFTDI